MFYKIIVAVIRAALYFIMPVTFINRDKAVYNKGVILAANHQSIWDVFFIAFAYKDNLNFMGKKELFKFKPFGALLKALGGFPVDRGAADLKAVKKALSVLKNNEPLLLFPEGTRVRDGEQVDVKNGVAMFALKTKSLVQPIALFGGFRPFRRTYVVFDDPVSYEEYYDRKPDNALLNEVSDDVIKRIRKIAEDTKKGLQKNKK